VTNYLTRFVRRGVGTAPLADWAPIIMPRKVPLWTFAGRGRQETSERSSKKGIAHESTVTRVSETIRTSAPRAASEQRLLHLPASADPISEAADTAREPTPPPLPQRRPATVPVQQHSKPCFEAPAPEPTRKAAVPSHLGEPARETPLPKSRQIPLKVAPELSSYKEGVETGAPPTAPPHNVLPEQRRAPSLRSATPATSMLAGSVALPQSPTETSVPPSLRTHLRADDRPTATAPPVLLRPATTALPPAARTEVLRQQLVTVNIGAIEIRAPEQRQPSAEQQSRPPMLQPAPTGFEAYSQLRRYTPWTP
jgi:hypothetical protein